MVLFTVDTSTHQGDQLKFTKNTYLVLTVTVLELSATDKKSCQQVSVTNSKLQDSRSSAPDVKRFTCLSSAVLILTALTSVLASHTLLLSIILKPSYCLLRFTTMSLKYLALMFKESVVQSILNLQKALSNTLKTLSLEQKKKIQLVILRLLLKSKDKILIKHISNNQTRMASQTLFKQRK